MARTSLVVMASAWLAAAAVVPAAGQVAPPTAPGPSGPPAGTSGRAPRAWFGGGTGNVGQTLTANLSLGYGRFWREPTGDGSLDPELIEESRFGSLSGSLGYGLDAGRLGFSAGAGASTSYYPAVTDDLFIAYGFSAAATYAATRRTSVTASAGLSYSPPFAQTLQGIITPGFGAPPIIPDRSPEAVEERTTNFTGTVGVSHQLSTRGALSAGYSHMRWQMNTSDQLQLTDDASVRYTHALTQGLNARIGYQRSWSRVRVPGEPDPPVLERSTIDAGLDFARALSLTRTTTVAFGAGLTAARSGEQTNYFVVGHGNLDQRIGRSWSASAHYSRDVSFVNGISEVVISDRFGGRLNGRLSRRVQLSSGVDYIRGDIGADALNSFRALTASASSSIAITRSVGLGVSYAYYRSHFANQSFLLAPGLEETDGHSVSASSGWGYLSYGVTYSTYRYLDTRNQSFSANVGLFAPLFARSRRGNATR